jgi:hypothetical protein
MTKYFEMNVKSLLTNPYLIFWSILFIEFWVFMWVFVFGGDLLLIDESVRLEAVRKYMASAYGNLLILSLSGACVTIGGSILYSSKSIRYVTKYTRLSPSRFLIENLSSSLVVLLVVCVVMLLSIVALFYSRFAFFILPVNPLGLAGSLLLSTLFIYALSLFLNLLIVTLKAPKSANFISFLPLIFGFIAYSALWIDFKAAVYVSPFNCITSICYFAASGEIPPAGNFFAISGQTMVDVNLALVSLTAWTLVLIVIDVLLLRKMRGVGVEEIRTT